MTEDQAASLREKLLAHRAQLLDHAAQQVDVDPHSFGWITMLGSVQNALNAIDDERDRVLVIVDAKGDVI